MHSQPVASSTPSAPDRSVRLWAQVARPAEAAQGAQQRVARGGTLKQAPAQSKESSAFRRMAQTARGAIFEPLRSHLEGRAGWEAGQEALLLEEGHTEQGPAKGTAWRKRSTKSDYINSSYHACNEALTTCVRLQRHIRPCTRSCRLAHRLQDS